MNDLECARFQAAGVRLIHPAMCETRRPMRYGLFTPPKRQFCLVSTQFRWVLSCPRRRCEHNCREDETFLSAVWTSH